MRKLLVYGTAVAALALGIACGGGGDTDDDDDFTSNAGPQRVASATAAPSSAGPVTAFADGTYEIGVGPGLLAPGKYKAVVPAGSYNCYWARLKGLSGQLSDILANDNSDSGTPVIVTIAATDVAFTTRGCGTWQPQA